MPAIRHDDLLLRLVKEVTYIRSALRRVTTNLPLYDIASENTPAQLTADQNDYAPGNYDVLKLSSSGGMKITGIRGGIKGRALRLFNVGDNLIVLKNQDSDSAAANRFDIKKDYLLIPGTSFQMYYDVDVNRWIPLSEVKRSYWEGVNTGSLNWRGGAWSQDLGIFCLSGLIGAAYYTLISENAIKWSPYPQTILMTCMCWSPTLGIFCGFAGSNDAYTSADGITWASNLNVTANNINCITWSEELGLFCGMGTFGRGAISPDGINWTDIDAGMIATHFVGITWSPELGLFCAVSSSVTANQIATSPDGTNWTPRSASGVGGQWLSVAWSPKLGYFIAVSPSSPYINVSNDGILWTVLASPPTWYPNPYAVVWATGLEEVCVIGGPGTTGIANIIKSPDLANWSYEYYDSYTDLIWGESSGKYFMYHRANAGTFRGAVGHS